MLFFKKETEVQQLMEKHVEIVSQAVAHWKKAFFFYLKKEERNRFEEEASATIQLETKADQVRRQAQLVLYQGAYLPAFREDLLDLLELTDNIADDAEKGVDFLRIQYPEIQSSWHEELKIIVEKSHQAFVFFKQSFAMLQKERSNILIHTHEVQKAEKEVDKLQDELMAKIFKSSLSLANKLQLKDLVLSLIHI